MEYEYTIQHPRTEDKINIPIMATNILAIRRHIDIFAYNILQQTGTTTSVLDRMLNNI